MTRSNAEAEGKPAGVNVLVLLPTAITIAAFYDKVIQFGHVLASLCAGWLQFWAEIWRRLFLALSEFVRIEPSPAVVDLITLWTTLSAAIGILPLILSRSRTSLTTVEAIEQIDWIPPQVVRVVAFVAIAAGTAFLLHPFVFRLFEVTEVLRNQNLDQASRQSGWLSAYFHWMGEHYYAGMGLSLCFLLLMFGWIFFRGTSFASGWKAALTYYAMSLVSLITALLVPSGGWEVLGGVYHGESFIFGSLFLLLFAFVYRSALPLVQLSLIVVAIILSDQIIQFAIAAWQAVRG